MLSMLELHDATLQELLGEVFYMLSVVTQHKKLVQQLEAC
jgi:hypothetical protein